MPCTPRICSLASLWTLVLAPTLSAAPPGPPSPPTSVKTPVADLLARDGESTPTNLLDCGQDHARPSCRLREGDLSFAAAQRLEQPSLVRYRYTLDCSRSEGSDLSLFAIRTADQLRILKYQTTALKSNVFGPINSKVELVLMADRATVNAALARQRCTSFTIDEVKVEPVKWTVD